MLQLRSCVSSIEPFIPLIALLDSDRLTVHRWCDANGSLLMTYCAPCVLICPLRSPLCMCLEFCADAVCWCMSNRFSDGLYMCALQVYLNQGASAITSKCM